MRSPQAEAAAGGFGNETPPLPGTRFRSTVSLHKLRRFNILILVFRFAAFCFSLASAIFMFTNSKDSDLPSWQDFDAFRFVAVANAIVALYSLMEIGASIWEILRASTFLPEIIQVWFDFGHDQVFAYVLLSANSAGASLARTLKETDTCTASNTFCIQSDISIALGFAGFLFIGFSSLLSGFRVANFIINYSGFYL
ncbi:CASP-like protein 4C1 [Abeliophyllum distichum]|uniref:CASP-like protein n=1 Tax=Abeliophyllum distichum TaxID=126358 RepID=A0ABD1UNS0_9LAMI